MDWTSWSQTWSTKSTTTSRRPLRRSRKNLRWKRMYLLLQADQRLKQDHEDLPLLAHLQELFLFVKEYGLILNHGTQSNLAYPVAKRLNTLLRHGQLPRKEDGAIEFWRLEDYLRNDFENSQHWSDEMWKSKMQGGGGNKKRFQYCTDSPGQEIVYLRALQGDSGRNPNDPTLQDNLLILDNFFEYIYHIGCAISLHSISTSGLIPGGQNSSRDRQTIFSTAVNPMDKEHKDPYKLDLTKPRLAWYKQKKWKRHQDTVYWVDIQLAQRKGLKFYQTKIERNHPLRYTPSSLYLESCCDGIWRNHIRESICVTSTTSNDFLQR